MAIRSQMEQKLRVNPTRKSWPAQILILCLVTGVVLAAASLGITDTKANQPPQEPGKSQAKGDLAKKNVGKKGAAKAERKGEDYQKKAAAMEIRDAFEAIEQAFKEERLPAGAIPKRPEKRIAAPKLDAAAVDALIAASVKSANVQPAKITNDATFLRRVCLDLIGKPPTAEQLKAFVQDKSKDKRSRIVDQLLESPEYAQNWSRYWRDVIQYRATNAQRNQVHFEMLESWLNEEIGKNTSWDQIARTMITATGVTSEAGPANFIIAHNSDPAELAGEVSRVFLGVQIQCAQCHDHPYDSWKREQFHQFAAFFSGVRDRPIFLDGQIRNFEVVERGPAVYRMPEKANPQNTTPLAPRFTLVSAGEDVNVELSASQRRELGASYVTGQDNPWFAKAYVNRIWYVLMGNAFYTPVDDLGPTKDVTAPEILDAVAKEWASGGYDMKWLFRVLANTQLYQRESRATNTAAGKTDFAANCSVRLRADQIWDSIARALDIPAEGNPNALGPNNPLRRRLAGANIGGGTPANPAMNRDGDGEGDAKSEAMTPPRPNPAMARFAQMRTPRFGMNTVFGIDPSVPNDEVQGTIPQALVLMNSPNLQRALSAAPNTMLGKLLAEHREPRSAIVALYVKVLSREPNAEELKIAQRYVANGKNLRESFEDLLWCLINSTEFISRK